MTGSVGNCPGDLGAAGSAKLHAGKPCNPLFTPACPEQQREQHLHCGPACLSDMLQQCCSSLPGLQGFCWKLHMLTSVASEMHKVIQRCGKQVVAQAGKQDTTSRVVITSRESCCPVTTLKEWQGVQRRDARVFESEVGICSQTSLST